MSSFLFCTFFFISSWGSISDKIIVASLCIARYQFVAALNSSSNVEEFDPFLRKTLGLSADEIDQITQSSGIPEIAGLDHWESPVVEKIATAMVAWLEENVDDDILKEYHRLPQPNTCKFITPDGSLVFQDEEQLATFEKSSKKHLPFTEYSTAQSIVRSVQGFPSPEEFYENHTLPQKPVIMKGAARAFPAYRLWTWTYLAKKYGKAPRDDDEQSESLAAFFSQSVKRSEHASRELVGNLPTDWWGEKLWCGPHSYF